MARTAALGDGPIAFFKDGVQIEVPLSAIYFEGDAVHTNRADLSPTPPDFDNWIKYLASRGRLVAAVAPAAETAMKVTATAPGSPGNNIQVTLGPATNGNPAMVDVTVSETDIYKGLTLTSLSTQLGTSAAPQGTKPGLLRVRPPIPAGAVAPANGTATFTDAVAPALPTWTISGTGATAVLLEPQRPDTGFDTDFKVTVSEAGAAGAGTFTLKVVWTKTLTNVPLTGLVAALNAAFGYLVNFTAPTGASSPRQGTVNLAGGNESVAATPAVATILAPI